MGGTPLGAPIVGWVADTFGPRWALSVGAAAGIGAVMVAVHYLAKYHRLRMVRDHGRFRLSMDDPEAVVAARSRL
jgi:MFS family permease